MGGGGGGVLFFFEWCSCHNLLIQIMLFFLLFSFSFKKADNISFYFHVFGMTLVGLLTNDLI